MKKRISATVDERTEKIINKILRAGIYRNKSHVIEEAIKEHNPGDAARVILNISLTETIISARDKALYFVDVVPFFIFPPNFFKCHFLSCMCHHNYYCK